MSRLLLGAVTALFLAGGLISPLSLATAEEIALDGLSLSEAEAQYEFNQTRTCQPSGINSCHPGEQPQPVQWGQPVVEYRINDSGTGVLNSGSPEVTDELKHAVFESFDAWNDQECSDFEMIYGGTTAVAQPGYDPDSQTVNILLWQDDDWPHPLYDAVALTTVTYRPCNGEILSADIEFNTADYIYTNHEGAAGTQIDLRNTLTHEIGHFLGLDHSPNSHATMFATAPHGEISKRDLHRADIAGLCFIYPAGEEYDLPPCGGADGSNGAGSSRRCSTTADNPSPWIIFLAMSLIGILLFQHRRRQ